MSALLWLHGTVLTQRPVARPAPLAAAALVDHRDHQALVVWGAPVGDADRPPYTLLSLRPLAIAEPVLCSGCGGTGAVRGGVWVEAGADV